MALYTLTTYVASAVPELGGITETDIATDQGETEAGAAYVTRERVVELRLLEAMCANLAQIAESTERIARALNQIGQMQAG